jgi:hypothetical protein
MLLRLSLSDVLVYVPDADMHSQSESTDGRSTPVRMKIPEYVGWMQNDYGSPVKGRQVTLTSLSTVTGVCSLGNSIRLRTAVLGRQT